MSFDKFSYRLTFWLLLFSVEVGFSQGLSPQPKIMTGEDIISFGKDLQTKSNASIADVTLSDLKGDIVAMYNIQRRAGKKTVEMDSFRWFGRAGFSDSSLPDEKYMLCYILTYENDSIFTDCIDVITQPGKMPVKIVAPGNGDVLGPSVYGFQWTSPKGYEPSHLWYKFLVAEILPEQEAREALYGNPPVYKLQNIFSSSLYLNQYILKLKPGIRYAWQIRAYYKDRYIGSSEVKSFGIKAMLPDSSKNPNAPKPPKAFPGGNPVLNYQGQFDRFTREKDIFSNPFKRSHTSRSFEYHGNIRTEYFYSNIDSQLYGHPASYGNIHFQSTLSLAGIPFDINAVYSTYGAGPVFQYGLALNPQKLKESLGNEIQAKQQYISDLESQVMNYDVESGVDGYSANALQNYLSYQDHAKRFQSYNFSQLTQYNDFLKLRASQAMQDRLSEREYFEVSDSALSWDFFNDAEKQFEYYQKWLQTDDAEVRKMIEDSVELRQPGLLHKWKELKDFQTSFENRSTPFFKDSLGKRNFYLSKSQQIFYRFSKFNFGRVVPLYDELSMWGLPLKGMDVEYHTSKYFIGLTRGQVLPEIYSNTSEDLKRTVSAAKVGMHFGQAHRISIALLHSNDLSNDDVEGQELLYKNLLFSSGFKLSNLKNYNLTANYARSVLSISDSGRSRLFYALFDEQNNKDNVAFCIKGDLFIEKSNTMFNAYLHSIEKNYNSLLVPFMKQDNRNYDLDLTQGFLKDLIRLQAFMRNDAYFINPEYRLRKKDIGAKMDARLFKGFKLNVGYSPVKQTYVEQDVESGLSEFRDLRLGASYNRSIQKTVLFLSMNGAHLRMKSDLSENYRYDQYLLNFTGMFDYKNMATLNQTLSYYFPNANDSNEMLILNLNVSIRILKKFYITGGLSHLISDHIDNSGYSLSCSMDLAGRLSLNLKFNEHFIDDRIQDQRSRQNYVIGGLNIYW